MKTFKPDSKDLEALTPEKLDELMKEGIELAKILEKKIRPMRTGPFGNPPPKSGKAPPTWELVVEDMKTRDKAGKRKYGVRHQHDNGRDHLQDAYEEALDLAVYLKAEILKRKK